MQTVAPFPGLVSRNLLHWSGKALSSVSIVGHLPVIEAVRNGIGKATIHREVLTTPEGYVIRGEFAHRRVDYDWLFRPMLGSE